MLNIFSVYRIRVLSAPAPSLSRPHPSGTLLSLAPPGRLVEISGAHGVAKTSLAAQLVYSVQQQNERAAWVMSEDSTAFPPDLARNGIDLEALLMLRIAKRFEPYGLPRAAELILRSGSLGLLILDCTDRPPPSDLAWQRRLLGLARQYQTRLVALTQKERHENSISSLVCLRAEPVWIRTHERHFLLEFRLLKNKAGFSDLPRTVHFAAPWGLR